MSYTEIEYGVQDGIATVTLNRPHRMNAYTYVMRTEMLDAFDRIDADDAVRAVVVTGAGRAFCAGADLGGGGDTFDKEKSKDMFAGRTTSWRTAPRATAAARSRCASPAA
ncbi:enoyl-CoA hydratase-related protein [Actinomadura yumaensis]|uniref:enoyl-CoA hydratase-related protein n=1 Tax=Actinomadura TaxID=1988 RepID=UPI002814B704|nr:enoyl-CoA hydratase-related protein [Actinomadura sp. J1-007]